MSTNRTLYMSPSSLNQVKRCPYSYYLKYIKHIDVAEKPEALRFGSSWHRVLEILSMTPGSVCPDCQGQRNFASACALCEGTGVLPDDLMIAATRDLNAAYENKPGNIEPEDWEIEKVKLLWAASAYRWYYSEDPMNVVLREYPVEMPLIDENGRAVRSTSLKFVIDKIALWHDKTVVVEHKTTSSDIGPDSSYWGRLALDIQTRLYPYGMRFIQSEKKLKEILGEQPITTVLYDVYKKPMTSPKLLTQGESKQFIKDGEYCGQEFTISRATTEDTTGKGFEQDPDGPFSTLIFVNNQQAEMKPGAKEGTFAIRETPEMYGARLMQDICADPSKFFVRKEITRSDDDLDNLVNELKTSAQMLRFRQKNTCFEKNENQCENMGKCPYIPICYNYVDPDGQLPEMFVKTERTEANGN